MILVWSAMVKIYITQINKLSGIEKKDTEGVINTWPSYESKRN